MNKAEISEKFKIEEEIRKHFNDSEHFNAIKAEPIVGGNSRHEFDIYQKGSVIGGITTSPWKNNTGSNNSGGQDRVAAELLWLTLWPGVERRVMILSGKDMAERILKRWQGCSFPHSVEIFYYDLSTNCIQRQGILAKI
jgi:hypothetical protein